MARYCGREREAWTDFGDFGVGRREGLGKIDKFSESLCHPAGWTPSLAQILRFLLTAHSHSGSLSRSLSSATTLDTLVEMYPEYPEGNMLTDMGLTADAFLAGVDLLDLWERLGGTEDAIASVVRGWFIEEIG